MSHLDTSLRTRRSTTRSVIRKSSSVVVASVIAIACSGGGTSSEVASSEPVDDELEGTPGEYSSTFVDVAAPADCKCADGSPYTFMVRQADPTKLAIILGGGFACFSDATCKRLGPDERADKGFWGNVGILDFSQPDNPFADYSVVFVPNCTLDQLLGNGVTSFPLTGEIHQVGNINATAAVEWAAENFPDAEIAVMIGTSTGGAASPSKAKLLAESLPTATVKLLLDSTGEIGVGDYENLAKSNPNIRLARVYFAEDMTRKNNYFALGLPPMDGKTIILDSERLIETAGRPVSTWLHAGGYHSALNEAQFYEMQQNGVALTAWLQDFLDGEEVADQICTNCAI
jgi:hypothetical protein